MTITIQEAKAFIKDAEKARESWITWADRSWNEIKKRQRNHRLWSITPNTVKRRSRYPAWYSIFKIRQPLVLSRVGIPIGKDTTQDGADDLGATAAMCLERLATNLARAFPFFDVMSGARDDFLATNFGLVRAYYERKAVRERVREYIQPAQIGEDTVFLDAEGNVVVTDNINQDDDGFFIELDEEVDVEDEKICLEHLLYKDCYVDPDIRRWHRRKRLAFACYYSEPEFKEIFGQEAWLKLPKPDDVDEASPKRQTIKVFEYWDEYEDEVLWFAELGDSFIKPRAYYTPDPDEDGFESSRGLYNLEDFFPCPPPLIMNSPTDEFWPVPEYYQLVEVFEDIHTLFSRAFSLSRAIRARLLFDNNVDGLQAALNEAAEGDAFGVPNLAQSLVNAGGSLDSVVQYIPVKAMVEALQQVYQALEQRLNVVYKLTGTSDLLQGLITDQTQRTFGERQMLEKYALNQLDEPQRKMAEFVKDSYQLLCEMALKNFKDASLEKYIIPRTLPPDKQQMYPAALELLKNDQKRFRIELETDSTIAINEQYDKQMRVELVNALTAALEKTAQTAQSSPALVQIELHALKFLVQGFRQAKMFQSEITQAIDNVIKQAEEASKQKPFNPEEAKAQIAQQDLQIRQQEVQLKLAELTSKERMKGAELNADAMKAQQDTQVEVFKVQTEAQSAAADRQLAFEELQSEISIALQDIALRREAIAIESQQAAGDANLTAQLEVWDRQLEAEYLRLEQTRVALDEREKYMTEARLQAEHELEQFRVTMEQRAAPAPITINAPTPTPRKRKTTITKKDKKGASQTVTTEIQG